MHKWRTIGICIIILVEENSKCSNIQKKLRMYGGVTIVKVTSDFASGLCRNKWQKTITDQVWDLLYEDRLAFQRGKVKEMIEKSPVLTKAVKLWILMP